MKCYKPLIKILKPNSLTKRYEKQFVSYKNMMEMDKKRLSSYVANEIVQVLPCNQCVFCKRRRRMQWVERMSHEKKRHKYSYFVTLTYSNDNLFSNELQLRDMQNFIKYMRRYFDISNKKTGTDYYVRYFSAGEYGSITKRPHFHLILFTNKKFDLIPVKSTKNGWLFKCSELSKYWKNKGHIWVAHDFDNKSFSYVSSYSCKSYINRFQSLKLKEYEKMRDEYLYENSGFKAYEYLSDKYLELDFRRPEFNTFSRGIGDNCTNPRNCNSSLLKLHSARLNRQHIKKIMSESLFNQIWYNYLLNPHHYYNLDVLVVDETNGNNLLKCYFSWYNEYILHRRFRTQIYLDEIKYVDLFSTIEYLRNKNYKKEYDNKKWQI